MLYEVSAKEISNLGEEATIYRDFQRPLNEHKKAQHTLKNYSEELDRLNNLIDQRESDFLELQESIKYDVETNQTKQTTINRLKLDLTQTDEKLRNLKAQKITLSEERNQLKQDLCQKRTDIDQLTNQLSQYSKIRMLKGEYIGNLSDRNSKYHFDRKCNHWKMLVGEYVLSLDVSREIVSSRTSTFFVGKLGECDKCAGRKSY